MDKIEHCNRWYNVAAQYRLSNWRGAPITFIYSGGKCSHCGNWVLGYATFDHENRKSPAEGFYLATGKTRDALSGAIKDGRAVIVDSSKNYKEARSGIPAGIGEWTQRAGSGHYILKLEKLLKLPNHRMA